MEYKFVTVGSKRKIVFACPICSARLESPIADAGQRFPCPTCSQEFEVPGSNALRREAEAAAQAKARRDEVRELERLEAVEKQKQKTASLLAIEYEIGQKAVAPSEAAPADPRPAVATAPVSQPRFVYKMVQVPSTIQVQHDRGGDAAKYLETVVSTYASQGWEFFRVDTIGVHVPAGCLGVLLGHTGETMNYYVVTFRKGALSSDAQA